MSKLLTLWTYFKTPKKIKSRDKLLKNREINAQTCKKNKKKFKNSSKNIGKTIQMMIGENFPS